MNAEAAKRISRKQKTNNYLWKKFSDGWYLKIIWIFAWISGWEIDKSLEKYLQFAIFRKFTIKLSYDRQTAKIGYLFKYSINYILQWYWNIFELERAEFVLSIDCSQICSQWKWPKWMCWYEIFEMTKGMDGKSHFIQGIFPLFHFKNL